MSAVAGVARVNAEAAKRRAQAALDALDTMSSRVHRCKIADIRHHLIEALAHLDATIWTLTPKP